MDTIIAKTLLGLGLKAKFSLSDTQCSGVADMAGSAAASSVLAGKLYDHKVDLAKAFFNVVTVGGTVTPSYGVWSDARKLYTAVCAKTHHLNEDTVKKYLNEALALLKDGLEIDDVIQVLVKPAKATPDAVRMSAKRKAEAEKFDSLSDKDLQTTAETLAKSVDTIAEAGEYANQLAKRVKTADKKVAADAKKAESDYGKAIRSTITDADVMAKAVCACILSPQGSAQDTWVENVIADFKEQKF
jgi:RPA family protein